MQHVLTLLWTQHSFGKLICQDVKECIISSHFWKIWVQSYKMQRRLSSLKALQWKHLAPHSHRLILHVILMIPLIVNSETSNTEHCSAQCPLLGLALSQLYALQLICTQQSHLKKHLFSQDAGVDIAAL